MKHVILYGYIWFIMLAGWLAGSVVGDCMVLIGIVILAGTVYSELFGELYIAKVRVI